MGFDQLHERGRETFAALVPGGRERLEEIFRVAPALAELAVGTVYGHLHDRPALDSRMREAATLAAIIAAGMPGTPLAVHLRTGLAAGLAPGEIVEVILQTAAFSGFPRAVASLQRVEEIFDKAAVPVPPPRSPREIVLAAIDKAPDDWAVCRAPDAEVSVHTIAADRAVAVVTRAGNPEAVLHVLVDEDRIVKVTELR